MTKKEEPKHTHHAHKHETHEHKKPQLNTFGGDGGKKNDDIVREKKWDE